MGLGGILMQSGFIYIPKPQCRVSDFLKVIGGGGPRTVIGSVARVNLFEFVGRGPRRSGPF